jgi:ADP-heptose:LPS heptosyltransferase
MINLAQKKHVVFHFIDFLTTLGWCLLLLLRFRFFIKKRIVAITLIEHMGDIVACEPVSGFVRQQEPDSFIVWFVRMPYREIVRSFDSVNSVKSVYCLTTWIRIKKFKLFDRVVDLHINDRICPYCRIPHLNSEGDVSVTLNNYFDHGSICEAFSKAAGLPTLSDQPRLNTSIAIKKRVNSIGLAEPYIVIHCRSNESCKEWSPDNWSLLLEQLMSVGSTVVEVGHDSNLHICNITGYRNLCGRLSIMETAEVIRRATLFIGIDSGPAHIANAVGTYGVILLGKYRAFERYLPYTGGYADGTNATLMYSARDVAELSVESVYDSITVALDRLQYK